MQSLLVETAAGATSPLGASHCSDGINFAIFSHNANSVILDLFKKDTDKTPWQEIPLTKTGNIWHVKIKNLNDKLFYSFRIDGPKGSIHCFNPSIYLLDPYATGLNTGNDWGKATSYQPKGVIYSAEPFNWEEVGSPDISVEDLIIYEMHVRGYTVHKSSKVNHPGTYLGVIEKIPHLLDLGINAVELMPIHEFNECENPVLNPATKSKLFNFWGYSTTNYFSPMQRYASEANPLAAIVEFKTMVKELHRNGIQVILDVVYNHTAEGNEKGPVLSWKGIDNSAYYLLDNRGHYVNYSGTGNTINCGHQCSQQMILDSLRYWVSEMHVDGFRFDLAAILTRGANGQPLANPPLLDAMAKDPIFAKTKFIAEPWDAAGLYQVGGLYQKYPRWSEWNGKYRDSVRHFIRGGGIPGNFSTSLCGSQNLYYNHKPDCSINFITAHDGFSLADLVSYNSKHNLENGENNQDGSNYNESWNCGVEGDTQNKKILALRQKQMKNHLVALLISRGIPMILMGDEYGHTKKGNNNTWCQDNELSWFSWDNLKSNADFYRFVKSLIQFRHDNPVFRKNKFFTDKDIDWHGREPFKPNFSPDQKFIALTIKSSNEGSDFYIAFNASPDEVTVVWPKLKNDKNWHWVINTAIPCPYDYREKESRNPVIKDSYMMHPFSAIILESS